MNVFLLQPQVVLIVRTSFSPRESRFRHPNPSHSQSKSLPEQMDHQGSRHKQNSNPRMEQCTGLWQTFQYRFAG